MPAKNGARIFTFILILPVAAACSGGDGADEWVVSPVELPTDPDVPGYYFPRWQTTLLRWDEAALALDKIASFPDAVPALVPVFRGPERTTSMSYLYPALTTMLLPGCALKLILRTSAGETELVDL
jgi:hypothetical protein